MPSNRIKETLHKAIDGNQFAFIKDKNIMAFTLITNEATEDYRHHKKSGLILSLIWKRPTIIQVESS